MGESHKHNTVQKKPGTKESKWMVHLPKTQKRQHNASMSEVKAVVPLGLSEYLALFRLTLFSGSSCVKQEGAGRTICQLVWVGQARRAI